MSTHTNLKGSPSVYQSLLEDQLEANLSEWLNWGLLGAGGYFNVRVPTSGTYGGHEHRLRLVDDPNYDSGQVWEGFRKDWVWESGVERVDAEQPIRVSGVFVNGGYQPGSGEGSYAHLVDYPNGRVVFSSAIPASSQVTAEFSYRLYQVRTADMPEWQHIQTRSFRLDNPHFLQKGSGEWEPLAQSRLQLPAIVVEATPNGSAFGTNIGGGDTHQREVIFHVLAEDRWHYKWAAGALMQQFEKRIVGFDQNLRYARNLYALDADGSPRPSGLMYPDLVRPSGEGGCGWKQIRLVSLRGQEMPRLGEVRYAAIRATAEVDLGAM